MPIYDPDYRRRELKINGPALSAMRRDHYLSQAELAAKARLSRSAIARYETEPGKGITGRAWRQLCKALGLRSEADMARILIDDNPAVEMDDGTVETIGLYEQYLAYERDSQL